MSQLSRRLRRFLERCAIGNLTRYLVGGQALSLLLALTTPGIVMSMLLVPAAVLAGEWWRLLSFMFMPPAGNPVFALITLYFLWFMGSALEAHWGAARYNLYVLTAFVVTVAAAFAVPGAIATNVYITGSIFLAFAYLFPDFEILLFFVLPVKVKWLALVTWVLFGYRILFSDWAERLLALASVANFFLFFGRDLAARARHGRRTLSVRAQAVATRDAPRNVCAICGKNEKTHPNEDFRWCSRCEPPVAYCSEHLKTHEHRVAR